MIWILVSDYYIEALLTHVMGVMPEHPSPEFFTQSYEQEHMLSLIFEVDQCLKRCTDITR